MSIQVRRWWREALHLRGRLLVLVLVVALGTGFSLSLLQAGTHLRESYDALYDDNELAHLTIHLDAPRVLADDARELLKDHDVQAHKAQGRLVLDGNLRTGGDNWAARLIGVPDDWPAINDLCVLQSDFEDGDYTCDPEEDDATPPSDGSVYLHAPFADANGIDVGDDLDVTVSGTLLEMEMLGGALNSEFIVTTSHPEFLIPDTDSLAVIWVNQTWLQEQSGWDDAVDQILVRFIGSDAEAKAREVLDDFQDDPRDWADLGVRSMEVREDTFSYSLSEGDVAGFFELSYVMALVVAGITAATVAVSMRRIVESQGHTIGVLRSLGASRRSITLHYLLLSVAVGLAGVLPGMLIGWLGAGVLARWYQNILQFPVLQEDVRGALFLLSAFLALLAAAAGGGPAARRAGNAPILSTLRPLSARRPGRIVQRLTRRGGATWRMVLRNLTRRPRRTAYTVASLALAMVIAFSMIGLIQSMTHNVDDHFTDQERWDGIINLDHGTFRSEADDALADVGRITQTEPFLSRFVTVEDQDVGVRLSGLASTEMHGFKVLDGDAVLASEQAIVTRPFILQYEEGTGITLSVGDDLELHHGTEDLGVTVSAVVQEPLGASIYLPIDDVQELTAASARPEVDGYYVLTSGAGPREGALDDVPGFIQYSTHEELRGLMDGFTAEFREFSNVFALVGALFGAAVIINTTSTNLDERKVEHATLRALGMSLGRLRRALLGETLLIAIPAAVLGVILGLLATGYFAGILSRQLGASILLDVSPGTGAITAAGMAVVALVGTLTAARRVRRMDLAGLTKELAR